MTWPTETHASQFAVFLLAYLRLNHAARDLSYFLVRVTIEIDQNYKIKCTLITNRCFFLFHAGLILDIKYWIESFAGK